MYISTYFNIYVLKTEIRTKLHILKWKMATLGTVDVVGKQFGDTLAVRFIAHGGEHNVHLCVVANASMANFVLREMVKTMKTGDSISLITFTSIGTVCLDSVMFDSDVDIDVCVDAAATDSNMKAGLELISTLTEAPDAIILLTDRHISTEYTKSCSDMMKYVKYPMFTIGCGADHDQIIMQKFALRTNGMYFAAEEIDDIVPAMNMIVETTRTMVVRHLEFEIPSGWVVNELNRVSGSKYHSVGYLANGKERWICLKKASHCSPAAPLRVAWYDWNTKYGSLVSIRKEFGYAELVDKTDEITAQLARCSAAWARSGHLISPKY